MSRYIHFCSENNTKQQLVLFPYLGGNKYSYLNIIEQLADLYEILVVTLPGHDGDESFLCDNIDDLASILFGELKRKLREGVIFFGHSLGALIAFAVATKVSHAMCRDFVAKCIISASNCFDNPRASVSKDNNNFDVLSYVLSLTPLDTHTDDYINYIKQNIEVYKNDLRLLHSAAQCNYDKLYFIADLIYPSKDMVVDMQGIIGWAKYFSRSQLHVLPHAEHMYINNINCITSII